MPRRKRKSNKKKNSMQSVFTRYMLVVAVFAFWFGAISVRLVHLQVNQHAWLREQALNQRQYKNKTKMLRGTIFDRDERALAMSIRVKSLYADPTKIKDIEKTTNRIAKVLKINKRKVVKDLKVGKKKKRRFVWIKRKLAEEDYEKVNKKLVTEDLKKYDMPKVSGLHWRVEQKRTYPYKDLAAHVIGFTNSEHAGSAGVEMSQEKALKGEVTSKIGERDRLGRVYDETESEKEPANDVVLTISNSIQYKTEQALAKGVKRSSSKSGKAVVLDPKTGEILAMANYPTFNPNDFRKLKPAAWKNRVIQDSYPPGSVFKLITYGGALEEDLVEPENQIDCGNGTITIAGHTFNDSHSIGSVSYTKAFAHSSNVGAIKTGLKLGKKKFYRYARDFGFGKPTGIGLPAETGGILRSPKTWNGDSLASMSIGYEIGVTALQSATAFAIIANDGVRVQPHIVKEIRQSNGKTVSSADPKKDRIVEEETARDLRKMLQEVVTDGTAKRAQLNGYTSAGKTGTAWKYDARIKAINKNKYVSSFIGFAPADNPRVVIAVVMDEPRGAARNGGQVAAPVFSEIAEQVLTEMNVTPDGTKPIDLDGEKKTEAKPNDPKTKVVKKQDKKKKPLLEKRKEKATESKKKKLEKPKKSKPEKNNKNRKKGNLADRKKSRVRKTGARKNRET